MCRAEMELEKATAQYQRLHEKRPWHDGTFTDWSKEPSIEHPYHFNHGIRIWVAETDHGMGGSFNTRENPYADDEEDDRGHTP